MKKNKKKRLGYPFFILAVAVVVGFIGGVGVISEATWLNGSNYIYPNASFSENVNVTGYFFAQKNATVGDTVTLNHLQFVSFSAHNENLQIYADNDLNTGIHFAGPDILSFHAGGNMSRILINAVGNVGISTETPTQRLDVNGSVNITDRIFMNEKPLLANVTPGTFEYFNHSLYFSNFVVRRTVAQTQDFIVNDYTISNNAQEMTIYTSRMGANYPVSPKTIRINTYGHYSTQSAVPTFTFRVKHNETNTTLATYSSVGKQVTNTPWHMNFIMTFRTVGNNATGVWFAQIDQDNTNTDSVGVFNGINTSVANNIIVTVQWSAANPANNWTLTQGFTEALN